MNRRTSTCSGVDITEAKSRVRRDARILRVEAAEANAELDEMAEDAAHPPDITGSLWQLPEEVDAECREMWNALDCDHMSDDCSCSPDAP